MAKAKQKKKVGTPKKKKKKHYDTPKLRPSEKKDGKLTAGDRALADLLRGELDGRLAIAKAQKQLEADLTTYAGGTDNLTPPVIILIKKIVHKTLVTQQREKMALLGEADPGKNYLAMANSLRLDIAALENLLANPNRGKGMDLKDYITTEGKEKK